MAVVFARRQLACAAALALVSTMAWADHPVGIFGPGAGGPVTTPTANTLPAGKWSLGLYSEYRRFDTPSQDALAARAAGGGDAHSLRYLWSPSLVISYGLNDRFTLAAVAPYVKRSDLKEAHVEDGGTTEVHSLGDAAGLGDIGVSGYWRFWENGGGAAALSLGSLLPTGATDARSAEGERFATDQQPGSGAWRPFAGVIVSRAAGALGWHAHLRYTWATEGAQDTDLGDKVDYGVALSYRLAATAAEPAHHEHGADARDHRHPEASQGSLRWDLLAELNGEYQRPHRIGGIVEGERERIVYLAPGLRVSGNGGWTAALSVGVPVYQKPGAGHVDTAWRAVATVAYAL